VPQRITWSPGVTRLCVEDGRDGAKERPHAVIADLSIYWPSQESSHHDPTPLSPRERVGKRIIPAPANRGTDVQPSPGVTGLCVEDGEDGSEEGPHAVIADLAIVRHEQVAQQDQARVGQPPGRDAQRRRDRLDGAERDRLVGRGMTSACVMSCMDDVMSSYSASRTDGPAG
jgi:hypothetical protein